MALQAGLLAEVRRYRTDFDLVCSDETVPGRLVAIDITQARAQVALAEVGVGCRPLLRGVDGGYQVVARNVVVEKERRCKM
jgi:hypothetical protein